MKYYLKAEEYLGYFLLSYFIFAAFGAYLFGLLDERYNRYSLLLISMILASLTFLLTIFIDHNSYQYFYLICALSGFALGFEMTILPSIAGDVIQSQNKDIGEHQFQYGNVRTVDVMMLLEV